MENGDVDNSFENAMKLSEFALSQAKERGKNSCYVFEQKEYEDYLKSRTLLRQLHHAVNNGFEGFDAYFQPLVNAANGELTGGGDAAPLPFTGGWDGIARRIYPDSRRIRSDYSGRQVGAAPGAGCMQGMAEDSSGVKVNVNLSYVQVLKSRVLTDVRRIVDEFGVKPSSVASS